VRTISMLCIKSTKCTRTGNSRANLTAVKDLAEFVFCIIKLQRISLWFAFAKYCIHFVCYVTRTHLARKGSS
jgi:hypothetical protein